MFVSEINKVKTSSKLTKKQKISTGFAEILDNSNVIETTSATSVDSLFFLQDVTYEENTYSTPQEMLHDLENLRDELILGSLDYKTLESLKVKLENRSFHQNEKIEWIMKEIEVRIAVEIAKRGY